MSGETTPEEGRAGAGQALGIDHVGIVGHDLASLAAAFRRLGFQVTAEAHHEGGRTGNHCVMFAGSYLELVATVPGGTSATLARFLARYAGAHILAFRIDDEEAALDRLALAGFPNLHAAASERGLDGREGSPRVGFALVTPPDPPEGRAHLIRHRTPEVLWQPRFLEHPNHVVRLDSVEIVVAEPMVTAAWFSRVTGRPVSPDSAGGLSLTLPAGRIRLVPCERGSDSDSISPPWIRALALRTDDDHQALRAILSGEAVPHHIEGTVLTLRQDDLILRFEPMPT